MRRFAWSCVSLFLVATATLTQMPGAARAHWCHDLWASSYNLVVRPQSDTVQVPSGDSTTLNVWVQNNMGYPLPNFQLTADAASFEIAVANLAAKVTGYLMPGESVQHILTVSRTAGAETLDVSEITFTVSFGYDMQDELYGGGDTGVVIKRLDGGLVPTGITTFAESNRQATHVRSSALADYGDFNEAVDDLLGEYCVGRASWSTDGYVISDCTNGSESTQCCPTDAITNCAAGEADRGHTIWDWQHLWAAGDLAIRRSGLSATALGTLRERLMCGWNDTHLAFQAYAVLLLGYLGPDAGAQTFLTNIVDDSGSSDAEIAVAKAALLLLGSPHYDLHHAAVVAALADGDAIVEMTAAGALGIADADDDAVEHELLARVEWVEPSNWEEDGEGMLAAHIANLVAWERRGWATDAGDTGTVSFYSTGAASAPNRAPDVSLATVSSISGTTPLTVTFDASSCTDPDGDSVAYAWLVVQGFNDATETLSGETVQHTFTEADNYEVTLTASDDGTPGLETRRTFRLNVEEGDGSNGNNAAAAETEGSCSCSGQEGSVGALMVLLGLLLMRRRADSSRATS